MKNTNNFFNLYRLLPIGLLLLGISACTTSRPMVGETDGIYYDPTNEPEIAYNETIKESIYSQPNNNKKENLVRIGGKYFDKQGNTIYDYESESEYVDDYSNDYFEHQKVKQNNKYATWGDERENVNVSFNYYGNPYYNGFGWNVGYSWGDPFFWDYGYSPFNYWNPYNRFHNYYGYGWGNPYNYWNPYWGGYYGNPFWNGYYGNPYYGSGYYDPYYYNGRNVQRVQRGKGMNSNVTINRGSSHSNSQRMERIRRTGNMDSYNSNKHYNNSNNNVQYNRSSNNSNYGTRSGQRIRRQSSNSNSRSNNSRSYSSPQRNSSSSNWGSSSRSSSRSSGWSGSSSSRGNSGSSGTRIRR